MYYKFHQLLTWTCAVCDSGLGNHLEIRYGLCKTCINSVVQLQAPNCQICGISLSSEDSICLSCREFGTALPGIGLLRSACLYIGRGQDVLHAYKSGGARPLALFWANLLTNSFYDLWQPGTSIIPVPAHPGNRRNRGFDQVILMLEKLPVLFKQSVVKNALIRRGGAVQKKLTKIERSHNLDGSIFLRKGIQVMSRIILVDDVCTTGATLSTCAAVLRNSGCNEVHAITLFRD